MKEFRLIVCVAYALLTGLIPGALGLTCWEKRFHARSRVDCGEGSCMVHIYQGVIPVVGAGCSLKHETGYQQHGRTTYYYCNEDLCNIYWTEDRQLNFRPKYNRRVKQDVGRKLKIKTRAKLGDETRRKLNDGIISIVNDEVKVKLINENKVERKVEIRSEMIDATRGIFNYGTRGIVEDETGYRPIDTIKGNVVDIFREKTFSRIGNEVFDKTIDRPNDEIRRQVKYESRENSLYPNRGETNDNKGGEYTRAKKGKENRDNHTLICYRSRPYGVIAVRCEGSCVNIRTECGAFQTCSTSYRPDGLVLVGDAVKRYCNTDLCNYF